LQGPDRSLSGAQAAWESFGPSLLPTGSRAAEEDES
jgi:hypothetical protein